MGVISNGSYGVGEDLVYSVRAHSRPPAFWPSHPRPQPGPLSPRRPPRRTHPPPLTAALAALLPSSSLFCFLFCMQVPVVCYPGEYRRVGGISLDPFAAEMMEKSRKELVEERDAIKHLLPK